MTQRAYPLDDTEYLAEDVRLFHVARTTGIFNATGNDLQVTANNTMNVNVSAGYAFLLTGKSEVGGITYGNDGSLALTVETAESTTRYDYIAVRYDASTNTCALTYVKGSGSKPSAPVRTDSVYEIILAIITVRAEASEVTANDIEDTRLNETFCGLVVDGTERIPTQGMNDQFTQFMADTKATYEEISQGITPLEDSDIDDVIN